VSEYLRLGELERKRRRLKKKEDEDVAETAKRRHEEAINLKFKKLSATNLSTSFTAEDLKSAKKKFATMAVKHDPHDTTVLLVVLFSFRLVLLTIFIGVC
jgi:hypothetical protein